MSSKTFWRITAAVIIVAGSVLGGVLKRERRGDETIERAYTEALEVVSDNYVEEVDYSKAGEAAIQGMLLTLDPHSSYFTPDEYKRLLQDQESRFTGIGVSILRHRDGVYVQTPVPETPAAKAGLRFGDRIVEVDGQTVTDWTTSQVAKAVRGERGKRVSLKVERAGEPVPLNFAIVRDSVPQPSIRDAYMVSPGTGYIALTNNFTQTTTQEMRDAIERLGGEGMRQIVLDLRNNPGGLLDQAINVASLFVERGKPVLTVRGREGKAERVFKNTSVDPVDYTLVVLINRNSASASEIVAGAIQDHGRGIVVGETSFGKGLVQRVFNLPHGAGLTLTTAKYYTPYGRLIQREYTTGSYHDYYTRTDPSERAQPPSPAQPVNPSAPVATQPAPQPTPSGPPIKAAGGRVFYGGGGITPDYDVKPLDQTTPVRQRIFEASFFFTRQLAAGQIQGLESYRAPDEPLFGRHPRPTDYPVTDRVVEAFRQFVRRDPTFSLTPSQIESELEYVRIRLRDDIVTAAYGGDAGSRVLLERDPQILRALELFPEARQLAENIRRGVSVN